jgi:predicted RNase H-like nuclease (RuvC/YqgF family)
MVDQIQNRISEISEKVSVLVQALSTLKIENKNLAQQLRMKEDELTNLSNKHRQDLESSILATKKHVTESSSKNLEEKNKEIDALVKEIEICIEELKN